MHSSAREVDVVAAHAHHLLLVGHRVGGEGNLNYFTAEEERAHKLSFWSHHLHPPALAREFRDRYEVVVFDKLDGFEREIANHLRLFAGFHVEIFDVFERLVPVVAVTEIARSLLHFVFTPRHLLLADRDDFFRRVGNHLRAQLAQECFAPYRIADDVARIARSRRGWR